MKEKTPVTLQQTARKFAALAISAAVLLLLFAFRINRLYNIKMIFIIVAIALSVIVLIPSVIGRQIPRRFLSLQYQIADFLFMLNLAFIIAQLFFALVFFPTTVVQTSMYPTLEQGNTLIVRSAKKPSRFDIIILQVDTEYNILNPNSVLKDKDLIVKRLIGMPGDSFYYEGDRLYVNGVLMEEPYLNQPAGCSYTKGSPYVVPDDYYFVMGDNRGNSEDSRKVGSFHKSQLIGVALYRVDGLFRWVRV